jgi:thiol-disulfide isomerase/thioredoxin
MRLLTAAAISLALGLFIACADDKKPGGDDPKDRPGKLEALKSKFDTEFSELTARLNKAEDQGAARGIQTEMRELVAITAEKALTIANADPKDETGFAAAHFVVHSAAKVGGGGKEIEAAVGLIAEHHASNPKVKELLLPAAMGLGEPGEKLLKAVAEKGANQELKGTATFLRGYKIAQAIEDEEDEKKIASMVAEARGLIEQAVKDAPAARLGRTTVGEIGKSELENLKSVTLLSIGKPAPEVETTLLDGKKVKLSDYRGKVVLLDIWATWCPPCRAMIPHEREMVKNLAKKPFVLISVSADDEKDTLVKFLENEPMPWVHWWDSGKDNPVLKKYRVRAFPTLYLIDHTGTIKHKWTGKPENDKLDKAVEEAVKAAEKAKG